MININIEKLISLDGKIMPKNFEECVGKLRYSSGKGDCADCGYRPHRGVNWKKCGLRVKMFLREGGIIL